MTLSDDLRKTARRTYGVDLVDAELMFEAADRLDVLEAEVTSLNALLHRVVGRKP